MSFFSAGVFPGGFFKNGAGFPLDQVTGAAAGYSLRKLKSTYSGSAVRIRRSSDSTEQDIGFTDAGNLDTTALSAFVGGGTAFVVTWYDQSGNSRTLTQSTAGNQPTYGVGSLNSKFGIRFAASKYIPMAAGGLTGLLNAKPGVSMLTVVKPSTGAQQNIFGIAQGDAGSDSLRAGLSITSGNAIEFGGSRTDSVSFPAGVSGGTVTTAGQVLSATWDLATQTVKVNQNGTQVATSTTYSTAGSTFAATNPDSAEMGDYIFYHSDPLLGDMFEKIIYESALSASNRQTIERNQGAYYGVTVA